MSKLSSRRAAVVLSGSAIALTAALLPAQAATSGWRVRAEFAVRGATSAVESIDAVSARDAWASGVNLYDSRGTFQPVLRHWTGKKWQFVALPSRVASRWQRSFPIFTQVAASSASNLWVVSSYPGAGYLRLARKHWTLGGLPGSTSAGTSIEITAVSVASSGSVWAVVGLPNSAISPVAIQGTVKPLVLHGTPARGWQQAAPQPMLPAGANLTTVQAAKGGTVWIGGSVSNADKGTTAVSARWAPRASAWTIADLGRASAAKWELTAMARDGAGGMWGVTVAGDVKGEPERLWHLARAIWSQVRPAFGNRQWILTQLAAVPGTSSV